MQLKKGDYVVNPFAPDWGLGEIQDSAGKYIHVIFEAEKDNVTAFIREDHPLKKVSKPKKSALKRIIRRKTTFREISIDERVKRDGQNACDAITGHFFCT